MYSTLLHTASILLWVVVVGSMHTLCEIPLGLLTHSRYAGLAVGRVVACMLVADVLWYVVLLTYIIGTGLHNIVAASCYMMLWRRYSLPVSILDPCC